MKRLEKFLWETPLVLIVVLVILAVVSWRVGGTTASVINWVVVLALVGLALLVLYRRYQREKSG